MTSSYAYATLLEINTHFQGTDYANISLYTIQKKMNGDTNTLSIELIIR